MPDPAAYDFAAINRRMREIAGGDLVCRGCGTKEGVEIVAATDPPSGPTALCQACRGRAGAWWDSIIRGAVGP